MFGQLGQLASMLKNAGQIKQNIEQMKARLAAARFAGDAGGGQVIATANGMGELISLKIDPKLARPDDVQLLEDLVIAAVRDAVTQSRDALQKESTAMMGGLNIPGMDSLFT